MNDFTTYIIIGSGPSGVNAALTLLERGKTVAMYDVGNEEDPFPSPNAHFDDLKALLPNPYNYLLSETYQAVIPPNSDKLFEYPPARNFSIEKNNCLFPHNQSHFKPIISHHRGGLGIAWGANCLPFTDNDLKDFPINYTDLQESYRVVAKRVPIAGVEYDDLNQHISTHGRLSPPVKLNSHEQHLLKNYEKRKRNLKEKHRLVMGRARLAVNTDQQSTTHCIYCDRCLLGCGRGALYNPITTLECCQRYT